MARIVFFGAGSIGCYVGGLWAIEGLDVIFVGRDRIRDEIAGRGLRLTDCQGGDRRLAPEAVRFLQASDALADASLVVLTVKGPATREAARTIARHAPSGAVVLSLQNGVSTMDLLRAEMPGRTILRGIVGFNVASQGNGHFHRGTGGALWVEDAPALRPVIERLAGTAGALTPTHNMEAIAWGKLLLNLNNAVNALSGLTLRAQLSQRPYRRVLAASQREALSVMRAAGIEPARVAPLPPSLLPAFVAMPDIVFNTIGLRLQKIDAHARSSMADDVVAGRPTEIDFVNGEIVRLAARSGSAAPVNAAIVKLVRDAEAGGRRDWPGEELAGAVLGNA